MHGRETVERLDGTKTVKTWFTSGLLNGKPRKSEVTDKNGKTEVTYQAIYDDKGRLAEEVLEDGYINKYEYGADGKQKLTRYRQGETQPTLTMNFDKTHHTRTVTTENGQSMTYCYNDQGKESRLLINGGLHSITSYGPEGKWMRIDVYEANELVRSFYEEYDRTGRRSFKKTIMFDRHREFTQQFFYDENGRLEKMTDSRTGTYSYTYTADGKRISELVERFKKATKG